MEKEIIGAAYVEFGDRRFFIKIESNSFQDFKGEVIRMIAKYFYPAFDQEIISLNAFDKFLIKVKKDGLLTNIENSKY